MREGDDWVKSTSRKSLRLLGSVGEPINPEAWEWYHRVVGEGAARSSTPGGRPKPAECMITPLPGATCAEARLGLKADVRGPAELVDNEGNVLEGATDGNLVITDSWPGQMRTVWGDHERFFQTYFSTYRGKYFTGDGCRRDEDGYYWITGRSTT
jgi:acetyl-CoA synthetase